MRHLRGLLVALAVFTGRVSAEDITGRVVGADRQPLFGATVGIVHGDQSVTLNDGRLISDRGLSRVRTDRDGTFRLSRPEEPFILFAIHDRGILVRESKGLKLPVDLVLRPWGRINGTVRLGARPDPHRKVLMSDDGLVVFDTREIRSDEEGRFTFNHVVPGTVILSRTGPEFAGLACDLRWVEVEPGRTAEVKIGGVGCPVVGRVTFPKGKPAPRFVSGEAILARMVPPISFPPDYDSWSDERRKDWITYWGEGPGKIKRFQSQDRHASTVARDGSFRIEDVPPGPYSLFIYLYDEPPAAGAGPETNIVALVRSKVEIPAISGGAPRSDEPFRLPPLTAERFDLEDGELR